MRTVNVLWTSGVDSTYRIVELASEAGFIIQPYYIIDRKRRSFRMELQRIREMTELIRSNPATVSVLNDVTVVEKDSIAIDSDIAEAYESIASRYHFGSQYKWIAAFTRQYGLKTEISIEKGVHGCHLVGSETCRLEKIGNDACPALGIAQEETEAASAIIFENLLFPASIWNMDKIDEIRDMKARGYSDVFDKTWFCYQPIMGRPCGHCAPCRSRMEDETGKDIEFTGHLKYKLLNPLCKLGFKIRNRLD